MTSDTDKISCSVGILTFNSAASLPVCLESVKHFSEIIICDGGSTDSTIEIARKFGCVVIKQDDKYKYDNNKISDFSGVRNQLLDKSSNEWFLYIDSDEFLSTGVVSELRSILLNQKENSIEAYRMPRKFVCKGMVIDCAASYPNYQMRFFQISYTKGFVKKLHERILLKDGVLTGTLTGFVMVPVETDIFLLKSKHEYYLSIVKERLRNSSYKALFNNFCFTARALLGRLVKTLRSRFFYVGNKLPVCHELLVIRQETRLLILPIRIASARVHHSSLSFIRKFNVYCCKVNNIFR